MTDTNNTAAALEATLEQIEAISAITDQAPATEQDTAPAAPIVPVLSSDNEDDETPTFDVLVSAVTETEKTEMMAKTAKSFDERAQFERDKDAANDNIQKTLSKERKNFQGPLVAACMVALELDPRMVNDQDRGNARRNVYGIGKIGDLLKAVATGKPGNAVNTACVVSMFLFQKAGISFTGADALGATSDKVSIAPERSKHMKRHTVSGGTASTQMSSTMTALQAIGAVVNIGSDKHKVFQFTKSPVVARLKEVFAPTV